MEQPALFFEDINEAIKSVITKARRMTLAAVPDFIPSREEQERERLMKDIWSVFERSDNREFKRVLHAEYARLHAQRSPELVMDLERKQGLSRNVR